MLATRRAGCSEARLIRREESELAARVLAATWQEAGLVGCARKLRAAAAMGLPIIVRGNRTARSVGAYFDLITDDGRLFYGDSFHLGYFSSGRESLAEALDAHTDLVAELARLEGADSVLDVGCGLAAPALRFARRCGCRVTGVNISREQVRQAHELIAEHGLSDRVLGELFRMLRPGGHVGFSDLALREGVSAAEDRDVRAVLYHSAAELVTDWPAIFLGQGFRVVECRDIITETLLTWEHVRATYQRRNGEVIRRYGRQLANRTMARLERIRSILAAYGTFPVIAALKPLVGGNAGRRSPRVRSKNPRPTSSSRSSTSGRAAAPAGSTADLVLRQPLDCPIRVK